MTQFLYKNIFTISFWNCRIWRKFFRIFQNKKKYFYDIIPTINSKSLEPKYFIQYFQGCLVGQPNNHPQYQQNLIENLTTKKYFLFVLRMWSGPRMSDNFFHKSILNKIISIKKERFCYVKILRLRCFIQNQFHFFFFLCRNNTVPQTSNPLINRNFQTQIFLQNSLMINP